jgi:hypothetical protein
MSQAQSAPIVPEARIPRGQVALVLAGATAASFVLAWAVGAGLGADAHTLRRVVEALAIGIPATLAPVALRVGKDHWALTVVGAGMARMLLCLGYCFAVRELDPAVTARPLFLAVASGAAMILAVEVVATVRILSALDRGHQPHQPTRKPA